MFGVVGVGGSVLGTLVAEVPGAVPFGDVRSDVSIGSEEVLVSEELEVLAEAVEELDGVVGDEELG